jgi:pyridoxine 4-dehydrogenase
MDKIISSLSANSTDLLFGLGTSQIASLGRRISFKKALRLFETAFANNVNIIDTADTYGSGDSEYLIGKILEQLNANPFIITKAGFPYAAFSSWQSPLNQIAKKVKEKIGYKKNLTSQYITESIMKSLKRLRKKQVGAFLLHELTAEDIKTTDCWETLANVKKTGLSVFTGISSNEPSVVKEGIQSKQVDIVETLVQFGNKNSSAIVELCKANKIPVIANEVLGIFHSGLYNAGNLLSEARVLSGLEQINLFQLLIGVTYLNTKVNCILLGTKNEEHLLENIKSSTFFSAIEQNFNAIKKIFSDNKKK